MLRIFVVTVGLALMASLPGTGAFAAKGDPRYCTMDGCIANCSKSGVQPRKCPGYCSQKIPERKAAGKC